VLAEFPQRFNVLLGDGRNRHSNLTVDLNKVRQPIEGIEVSRFHNVQGASERISIRVRACFLFRVQASILVRYLRSTATAWPRIWQTRDSVSPKRAAISESRMFS
jgi:hypothetical protein